MAATPDFVDKNPDTVIAYLKCWQEAARDFKDNPGKVADVIYAFFTSKGYAMSRETFAKALAKVEGDPGFPSDLVPGLRRDALGPGRERAPGVRRRERKLSPFPIGTRRCGRTCGPRREGEADPPPSPVPPNAERQRRTTVTRQRAVDVCPRT